MNEKELTQFLKEKTGRTIKPGKAGMAVRSPFYRINKFHMLEHYVEYILWERIGDNNYMVRETGRVDDILKKYF